MPCQMCKKNIAVVFIKSSSEKNDMMVCMTCAKAMGYKALPDVMRNMGMTEESFDEMNLHFRKKMPSIPPDMWNDAMSMFKDMKDQGMTFQDMLDIEPEAEQGELIPTGETGGVAMHSHDTNNEKTEGEPAKRAKSGNRHKSNKKTALEQYTINLTDMAENGEIDVVIGREKEIERVVQILNRRNKNNPVLIGEPGVGKTAIAEGLALRIAQGKAPAKLLNKEVRQLDMATVVAGTQFRGQFEQRLKNILDEAKRAGNVIFVIDELHTVSGAGDAEGAIAAGNILKPALAKGHIQVMGATTLTEYRKSIEKDAALERRFQSIIVEEPTQDEAFEIIKGIRKYYEDYHSVKIPDDVIRFAITMSKRYITARFLPDKAIDLIDEASSRVNLFNESLRKLHELKTELQKVQGAKENAIQLDSIEEYQKAADLKIHECRIIQEIQQLEKEVGDVCITKDDIAHVIEMWTKIPIKSISESEATKLRCLEQRLHTRLIGQDDAVNSVARAIRINRANLSQKKRPASFIFVGPTGVGKTELVKQLCLQLFDSLDSLVRLDMSEYMEKHAISKLIGSPPGYVGYDDAGQLTEKIRRHPYSVILLDEIEKAHYDIFNLLLQILDDGRATDSAGRVVNFENTVIIMTSNAGSDENNNVFGFNVSENLAQKSKMQSALKKLFRPEFLNRIDEIVYFDSLTKTQLYEICGLMLTDLADGLKEKGINITFTSELRNYITEKGYDSKYGARPMKRLIFKEIESVIADMFINGEITNNAVVTHDGENIKVEEANV